MTSNKPPVVIKKYANRRLYNTGTSVYVTLDDLGAMVKRGDDFVVFDAKTGEDITRSVLTQIIFEQEGKGGQSLLPIAFLRQLIRFYGDSMQMMVPSYLEFTMDKLTSEKNAFRDQCVAAFGNTPLANAAKPFFGQIEEQTRQNMALFRQALSIFPPFAGQAAPFGMVPPNIQDPTSRDPTARDPIMPEEGQPAPEAIARTETGTRDEFEVMKRQLEELRLRMEDLASKA